MFEVAETVSSIIVEGTLTPAHDSNTVPGMPLESA
jgi:hypothetical protein